MMLAQQLAELFGDSAGGFHLLRPHRREQAGVIPVILHPLAPLMNGLGAGFFRCLAHRLARTLVGLCNTGLEGVKSVLAEAPAPRARARSDHSFPEILELVIEAGILRRVA